MTDDIQVLIIDDDDVFGELLQERLAAAGIRAQFHHGPFGTINLIRKLKPALVVSDVNMPAIPGDALCQLIQESPGLDHTRVLLVSSMHPRELMLLAQRARADDYLSKSATMDETIRTVTHLLARAKH